MTRMSVALGLLLSVTITAGCAAGRAADPRADLPFYGTRDLTPSWSETAHRVGHFSLVTQTGARMTDADLVGSVHVASFIYTRCGSVCPTLVSSLKRVAAAVDSPRLRIVSYSVTPEQDTPEVLAAFGRERGIDPVRWKLLTGDRDVIYALARDGYFANDERLRATLSGPDAFLHTEQLALVDQQGRIRGVYNGTQPFDLEHLIGDARALLD